MVADNSPLYKQYYDEAIKRNYDTLQAHIFAKFTVEKQIQERERHLRGDREYNPETASTHGRKGVIFERIRRTGNMESKL